MGRRLSPSQIEFLTARLRTVPKSDYPVPIGVTTGDDEAKDVGDALKRAFEGASFKVDGVWPGDMIGSDPRGILVRQSRKDDPAGVQVASALASVGLVSEVIGLGAPATPVRSTSTSAASLSGCLENRHELGEPSAKSSG